MSTLKITHSAHTPQELQAELGEQLRNTRLMRNIEQTELAARAGVSLGALKNLEGGRGATVHTLVSVVRALGRQDWLGNVAPAATINPLTLTRAAKPRQRATGPRPAKKASAP